MHAPEPHTPVLGTRPVDPTPAGRWGGAVKQAAMPEGVGSVRYGSTVSPPSVAVYVGQLGFVQ